MIYTNYDVEHAKEYALKAHGDQNHGSLKIKDHLTAVTNKLDNYMNNHINCDLYFHNEILMIGWLHDVLEDTDKTYENILNEFGWDIANYVSALTDEPGKTRTERHLNTYYRTRQYPKSILVKLADRWHNQKRSIDNKEYEFANDYKNEYIYFKFALYNPHNMYERFWLELDHQYEQLKQM